MPSVYSIGRNARHYFPPTTHYRVFGRGRAGKFPHFASALVPIWGKISEDEDAPSGIASLMPISATSRGGAVVREFPLRKGPCRKSVIDGQLRRALLRFAVLGQVARHTEAMLSPNETHC